MNRSLTALLGILRFLPRAAMIALLLLSPLLAMPSVHADTGVTIEAPTLKKKGMGLVLLVSLQRN
jgi:hypothetical protein